MAKGMGLNTIATYIFWNFHEKEGKTLDFTSPDRNLRNYIKIIQEEGMYLLIRPGPYVCGEWDLGGLPSRLLSIDNIRLRCSDPRYLREVEDYVAQVADILREFQVTNGGPILMLQIENEYGSYSNDRDYLDFLQKLWRKHGITVPFYTADGAWVTNWENSIKMGSIENAGVGVDPGVEATPYEAAQKIRPGALIFSAETYPGWMTHWGESYQGKETARVQPEVEFLLKNGKSFNLYVIHGGTNFGFSAGSNCDDSNGFQPQITSYDYDAPINEQGSPTEKYFMIRDLIAKYTNKSIPNPPENIKMISFGEVEVKPFATIWDNLPKETKVAQPRPMEYFGQNSGIILYRSNLRDIKSGQLKIKDLHDYGLIFEDDKLIDVGDRMVSAQKSVELSPTQNESKKLEILVEAFGRINFGEYYHDRKGITNYVLLDGITLSTWSVYNLDLNYETYISKLKESQNFEKEGVFFKFIVNLPEVGDTYLNLENFKKGIVWANGYNLGRYWDKGPQTKLFWPGCWMRKGENEIIILDLHKKTSGKISGGKSLH